MSPSRLFILRPVATNPADGWVALVGLVAYSATTVFPRFLSDYPTIQVVTFYPAPTRTSWRFGDAPLERQSPGPGLSQMTSTSSLGSSIITLQFISTRNHVKTAGAGSDNAGTTYYPRSAEPPIYSKVNPADSPILTLGADFGYVAAFRKWTDLADTALAQNFPASRRRTGFHQRRTEASVRIRATPPRWPPYGMAWRLRTALAAGQA